MIFLVWSDGWNGADDPDEVDAKDARSAAEELTQSAASRAVEFTMWEVRVKHGDTEEIFEVEPEFEVRWNARRK